MRRRADRSAVRGRPIGKAGLDVEVRNFAHRPLSLASLRFVERAARMVCKARGSPRPLPSLKGPKAGPSRVLSDAFPPGTLRTLRSEGGGPQWRQRQGLPLEEYRRAGLEITNGNAEVYKALYSRRGDVTLANPFGPPARGWSEVSATLDRAASNYRDGEVVGFQNVSTVITSELPIRSRSRAIGRESAERRTSRRWRSASQPSSGGKTAPGR
jgi:hypothetical protein